MNRALLVGINQYPSSPLRGCVNDVVDMANFLVTSCGFVEPDIRLLTDSRATTEGILDRLGWLLTGLRSGDRVLFHYSGHGAQMATRNPQGEIDGLDEVICPVDFDWSDEHAIRDKDFNRLFSTVPDGVEFVWISDSCHSGDLTRAIPPPRKIFARKTLIPPADLNWRIQTAGRLTRRALGMVRAGQGPNVALIAGCKDNQESADAEFNGKPNGALTYFLLGELKTPNGLSESLTQVVANVFEAVRAGGYSQEPQLEGSDAIKHRGFLQ